MLNQKISQQLNKQLIQEFYSSKLYLQMCSWCQVQGCSGCAKFFEQQAQEEMQHMMKIFHYLGSQDHFVSLGNIPNPPSMFSCLKEIFDQSYSHEKIITQNINQLVQMALEYHDYTTFNFLQWYVAEQREEEAIMKNILDKFKLLQEKEIFFIDSYLQETTRNN